MIDLIRTYHKHYTSGVMTMPDGSEIFTLELPWRDNTISTNPLEASCIPEGIYIVDRNHTGSQQWYALRNEETEPRTFIELHPATRLKHLQGCLAPCLDIKGGARTNDPIAVDSLEVCRLLVEWFGEKSWVLNIRS